jgi:hypothetical protein
MMPTFASVSEVLGEGLGERSRALLHVALEFPCWRTLSRSYPPPEAAALMSEAIALLGDDR